VAVPDHNEITPLRVVTRDEREFHKANDETIAVLRNMLAKAEAGEIVSVLIVSEMAEGHGTYLEAFTPAWDCLRRLGAIESVKAQWLHSIHRSGDEDR
jgi:hypothetical protein